MDGLALELVNFLTSSAGAAVTLFVLVIVDIVLALSILKVRSHFDARNKNSGATDDDGGHRRH